jgi:hypothetical protein
VSAPERRYSFACFPAERIAFVFAMIVAPAIAGIVVYSFRNAAQGAGLSFEEMIARYNAKPLAAAALAVAMVVILYGVIYLQFRARTFVTLNEQGIRFERGRFLPFGLLEALVYLEWSAVRDVRFRMSRRYGFERPELEVIGNGERILLPVMDAWDVESTSKRPMMPSKPKSAGGWQDHALVVDVKNRFGQTPG